MARRRRRRYGDATKHHGSAHAHRVHELAAVVVSSAAAGHCGIAHAKLEQMDHELTYVRVYAREGGAVLTRRTHDVAVKAGRTYDRFCGRHKR